MAQLVIPRPHALGGLTSPLELPNLAAWYALDGIASDSTYLISGSNELKLVADRSGNSAVNGLVLNGVVGCNASTPDIAFATTALEAVARVSSTDWTPAAAQIITAKYGAAGQRSFYFGLNTNGTIFYGISSDGTAVTTATSTAAPAFTDLGTYWVKATWVSATGVVQFFTAADSPSEPTSWTQLGADVTGVQTGNSIFDSTSIVEVGVYITASALPWNGIIYSVALRSSVGGANLINFNFSAQAKLAASFVNATGQTVTINTSGDLGARICGARDLVQLTTAKQPIVSVSGGFNLATFDGSNDYMKAAPFSLSQPESVYAVYSQVTWTGGRFVFDGNANSAVFHYQGNVTPETYMSAGSEIGPATNLALGVRGVVRAVANGASSGLALNRNSATTGNAGANNSGGFTLAARADGAGLSNITFNEALVFSAAHDTATQIRVAGFEQRKWGIA